MSDENKRGAATPKVAHKPNPSGRPSNIPGAKLTPRAQKSGAHTTGGPTSKGGR
jgi:hypothetical protein